MEYPTKGNQPVTNPRNSIQLFSYQIRASDSHEKIQCIVSYVVVGHLNPGDSCRSVLAVRSVKSPGRITERKKVYQHKQSQSLVSRISSSHRVQRVQIHGVVASQTARYGKSERGQSAESQKGRKKILPVLSAREVLSSSSRPIRARDGPAGPPTCRNDPHRGLFCRFFSLFSLWGGDRFFFFFCSPSLSFQRINSPTISTSASSIISSFFSTKLYIY